MSYSSNNSNAWQSYQNYNPNPQSQQALPSSYNLASEGQVEYYDYSIERDHTHYHSQQMTGPGLPLHHSYPQTAYTGQYPDSSYTNAHSSSNYPTHYNQSAYTSSTPPLHTSQHQHSYPAAHYNSELYDTNSYYTSSSSSGGGGTSQASSSPRSLEFTSRPNSLCLQSSSSQDGRTCSHCGTSESPLWRRHPTSNARLCNACGLYMATHQSNRPVRLIDQAQTGSDSGQRICSHCFTTQTGSWRRGPNQELLCNACGVYRKLKGKERPVQLANDPLKKRGSRKAQ
jgi:hypothetical protein